MVELYDTETLLLFYDQEATFGINLFLFFLLQKPVIFSFIMIHNLVKVGLGFFFEIVWG